MPLLLVVGLGLDGDEARIQFQFRARAVNVAVIIDDLSVEVVGSSAGNALETRPTMVRSGSSYAVVVDTATDSSRPPGSKHSPEAGVDRNDLPGIPGAVDRKRSPYDVIRVGPSVSESSSVDLYRIGAPLLVVP